MQQSTKKPAMIVNKSHSDHKRRPDRVAVITAEVELLSVSDDQELRLQNKVQEEIIHSLAYPEMTFRYERIVEAYPTTFEWVFRDPTADQLPWSSFSDWLETGDGVYWINGKAGSGKSTLMKHIFDSQRTRKCLATWANTSETDDDRPLCFATFFFWNSGTPEQKSQVGLLRSLLYQVLRTCPKLVAVILPDAWAMTYSAFINARLATWPSF
jgi:predicted ATPase